MGLIDVDDGYLSLMDDTGATRDDLKVPEAMLEMNAITPLLRAETLCALSFPPVEKRLSLPPRLTPLLTNNFVRCTLQNRIIKSLFSKIRRKNKNKKKTHRSSFI